MNKNEIFPNEVIEAYNDIWDHHPELQNWSSSSWWFFVFLPKQEKGYGPNQMMFSYASRQGRWNSVNRVWQKGFSLDRDMKLGIDHFMTTVVGWIRDEKGVHEEIVHTPALAELNYNEQYLKAWNNENGAQYGATIKKSDKYPLGIDGYFKGKNGYAKFTIYPNSMKKIELPELTDIRGPINGKMGNTRMTAWRKFKFEGEFATNDDIYKLEGLGYFQRVLMNIPMPPWKWSFTFFEDGSIFSAFIIYFGLHNFRRTYKFYSKFFERFVVDLIKSAYFYDATNNEIIYFNKVKIIPDVIDNMPNFYIEAKNNDSLIRFYVKSHGHAQFLLDRRIFKKLWQTKWNYNEYMYKIIKSKVIINGKEINLKEKYGNGFGNMEYTWGWSL